MNPDHYPNKILLSKRNHDPTPRVQLLFHGTFYTVGESLEKRSGDCNIDKRLTSHVHIYKKRERRCKTKNRTPREDLSFSNCTSEAQPSLPFSFLISAIHRGLFEAVSYFLHILPHVALSRRVTKQIGRMKCRKKPTVSKSNELSPHLRNWNLSVQEILGCVFS